MKGAKPYSECRAGLVHEGFEKRLDALQETNNHDLVNG
jgi:hypothetical protein